MATIADFRDFILQESGSTRPGQFCGMSVARAEFWLMFHKFSWQRYKSSLAVAGGRIPEDTQNFDALVELTDEEWNEFVRRFRELPDAVEND